MNQPRPTTPPSLITRIGLILFRTGKAFVADNIGSLGAALAFYTTLAIAPLLVLAIAGAGILFNEAAARDRIISEVTELMGKPAGAALKALPKPSATDKLATVIGAATLIFGGLGVFNHLRGALNSIWRTEPPKEKSWREILLHRLFSGATVIVTGFLLLVSLIASAVLSWAGVRAFHRIGLPLFALQAINLGVSLLVITLLFAIIFKLLPDVAMEWRHVWVGSLATAALFTAGKGALSFYLGRASVTSVYGAAGSLVVLLLWCYYAAQIVFFGAELTRIASLSDGGRDFTALDAMPRIKRLS